MSSEMYIVKTPSELMIGKKYAYASNGYVLGEYYGCKTISNYCTEKCECEFNAKRLIYEFNKGNRDRQIFEVGLVEIENGSIDDSNTKCKK